MLIKNFDQMLMGIKIMDFDMFLEMYPNTLFYPKNSRKAFSKKINEIFDELKSSGDTFLKIKDCTKLCDCGTCKPDPNKYHIAFIGNVSNDYFGLTINMNKDNEPFYINNSGPFEFSIYEKNSERYNETDVDQIFEDQHCFAILEDEQDDFVPSDEYLDAILLKEKAIKNLENKQNTIESIDELTNWLANYKCTIFEGNRRFKMLQDFDCLYSRLEKYDSLSKYNAQAKLALDEFSNDRRFNPGNEFEWLMKYEDFYSNNFSLFKSECLADNDDYFYYENGSKYKISRNIFKDCIDFIKAFHGPYEDEKYFWQKLVLESKNKTLDDYYKDFSFVSKLSVFYNLISKD